LLRSLAAGLAGMTAAVVTVMLGETLSMFAFPPPAGMNPDDPASVAKAMEQMPVGALVTLVVIWTIAAFVGVTVAARIARGPRRPAILVAIIFLAGVAGNFAEIPHPAWMVVAGTLGPIAAAILAIRLTPRPPAA
jgi:hypothetical protein